MTFSRLDFCFKAAAQLPDILLSPTTSHSSRLDETAFAKAANIDGTFFEYLDLPGNERQRERFGAAMAGLTQLAHPDSVLEGLGLIICLLPADSTGSV